MARAEFGYLFLSLWFIEMTMTIKKAIIIGATSGIGYNVARCLAGDGVSLGIAGRRVERLERIAAELGGDTRWHRIDVTAAGAEEEMEALIEKVGDVDLIFLSAGTGHQNKSLDTGIELATADVNVVGFIRIVDAAYRYFRERGRGHIAVISSIAGTKGLGAAPAYSATKRFQSTYIQCLAQLAHMKKERITFTDIRPGFVDTDLLHSGGYPMLMKPDKVARSIVKALYRRRRKVVIDGRYRLLVGLWRMIPDCVWEKMTIQTKQ